MRDVTRLDRKLGETAAFKRLTFSAAPDAKVIGAGLGRTGTDSLRIALTKLGYKPYHMFENIKGGHSAEWNAVAARAPGAVDVIVDKVRTALRRHYRGRGLSPGKVLEISHLNFIISKIKSVFLETRLPGRPAAPSPCFCFVLSPGAEIKAL